MFSSYPARGPNLREYVHSIHLTSTIRQEHSSCWSWPRDEHLSKTSYHWMRLSSEDALLNAREQQVVMKHRLMRNALQTSHSTDSRMQFTLSLHLWGCPQQLMPSTSWALGLGKLSFLFSLKRRHTHYSNFRTNFSQNSAGYCTY